MSDNILVATLLNWKGKGELFPVWNERYMKGKGSGNASFAPPKGKGKLGSGKFAIAAYTGKGKESVGNMDM